MIVEEFIQQLVSLCGKGDLLGCAEIVHEWLLKVGIEDVWLVVWISVVSGPGPIDIDRNLLNFVTVEQGQETGQIGKEHALIRDRVYDDLVVLHVKSFGIWSPLTYSCVDSCGSIFKRCAKRHPSFTLELESIKTSLPVDLLIVPSGFKSIR